MCTSVSCVHMYTVYIAYTCEVYTQLVCTVRRAHMCAVCIHVCAVCAHMCAVCVYTEVVYMCV